MILALALSGKSSSTLRMNPSFFSMFFITFLPASESYCDLAKISGTSKNLPPCAGWSEGSERGKLPIWSISTSLRMSRMLYPWSEKSSALPPSWRCRRPVIRADRRDVLRVRGEVQRARRHVHGVAAELFVRQNSVQRMREKGQRENRRVARARRRTLLRRKNQQATPSSPFSRVMNLRPRCLMSFLRFRERTVRIVARGTGPDVPRASRRRPRGKARWP